MINLTIAHHSHVNHVGSTTESIMMGLIDIATESITIAYHDTIQYGFINKCLIMTCSVSIGRIGALECDFIFRHGDADYAYAQVAMTIMADKTTENREYAPLERIRDNYPKFVLTRNDPIQKRNGIIHENLPDFMRQGSAFGYGGGKPDAEKTVVSKELEKKVQAK